jgi:hypothetical protein
MDLQQKCSRYRVEPVEFESRDLRIAKAIRRIKIISVSIPEKGWPLVRDWWRRAQEFHRVGEVIHGPALRTLPGFLECMPEVDWKRIPLTFTKWPIPMESQPSDFLFGQYCY